MKDIKKVTPEKYAKIKQIELLKLQIDDLQNTIHNVQRSMHLIGICERESMHQFIVDCQSSCNTKRQEIKQLGGVS
jgi:hypothetical protein